MSWFPFLSLCSLTMGWKDPLEKEMATKCSILAWRIPRTEEPGGLQSVELQRVEHDLATKPRPRHFLSFLSDPSRLTGTGKLSLEENLPFVALTSSVFTCPGVLQIYSTQLMFPSPCHVVLCPLFSPLFPFLFP